MNILPINDIPNRTNQYTQIQFKSDYKHTGIAQRRVKTYERDILLNDKIKALIGTTVGTAIPILLMMKNQKIKNPFKLKYKMSDMIKVPAGAIIGGVSLGLINEEKQVKKDRLKEGLFQFMNAVIPTCLVGSLIKLCETSTKYNTKSCKILSSLVIFSLSFLKL